MTGIRIGLTALACLFPMLAPAWGQVTVDVSKITCEQFRNYSVTDPNNIALWLSGYYNGRRNNTIISISSFTENLDKLKDYCITHQTTTVMKAVEDILGAHN